MTDQATALRTLAEQSTPPLGWRSWPLREDRAHAAMVLLGVLLVGVLVSLLSGRVFLGGLAAGVVALSMWRFFLPVVFEIDHRGLNQWLLGRRRHIPWTAVKRHQVCTAGVLLLSQKDEDRMCPLRGLYVPWSEHRQELLDFIEYHAAEAR